MTTKPPDAGGPDEDDFSTPVDLVQRIPASFDRVSIGTAEAGVNQIAGTIRALRERWDASSDVGKRALAERLAPEARQLGDDFHDLARWMTEFSVGVFTDDMTPAETPSAKHRAEQADWLRDQVKAKKSRLGFWRRMGRAIRWTLTGTWPA